MDNRNAGVNIKKTKLKVGRVLKFKNDWEGMVGFLQQNRLISKEKSCPNYMSDLIVQEGSKNRDGALWRYVIDFFYIFIWFFLKK